jgi:hypothetical protein
VTDNPYPLEEACLNALTCEAQSRTQVDASSDKSDLGHYGRIGQVGSNAVNLEHKASKVFPTEGRRFCGGVQAKPTVRVIFSLVPHP